MPFFGSEKVLSAELSLWGRFHRVREVLFYLRQHVAESEPHRSAEQQQAYVGTASAGKLSWTRFKLLWGHLTAVWRPPLSMAERARCFAAVLEYVLQLRKWKRILTEMQTGAPINSGEKLILVPSAERLTIGQILRSVPDGCDSDAQRAGGGPSRR
jgi:hypothetical protein